MEAAARVPNGLPVRIEKGETNAGAPMLAKRPEPPPGVGGGAIAESARSEEVREAVREAVGCAEGSSSSASSRLASSVSTCAVRRSECDALGMALPSTLD
jgi:hypothetical protein|tara:strand:- start:72 stop:371 length:300 start_codon:yes stop_codon:yes gene_type:complete